MRRFILAGLSLALTVSMAGSLPGSAVAAGQPDDPTATAALATAQEVFTPLGANARGTGGTSAAQRSREATLALADLVKVMDRLSPAQRKQAEQLLARPDGTNGIAADPVVWNTSQTGFACATHVCIHYVQPGVNSHAPADTGWAETTTLNEMEAVYDFETGLGYRAPATDGTAGGDSRFDVYLADLGPLGLYGYCAPEKRVSGQVYRYTAYCVLDNDFVGFPLDPTASMQVTAAHEFFHAIQFNYDTFEDHWIMEATATWMEERYADGINDNRQYIRYGQTHKPKVPLDKFGGFTHYGNWTFFEKLSQDYGVSSVLALWNRMDATKGARDQYSLQSVKGYLESKGTTLPKFYGRFAAGNLDPAYSYSEGSVYPAAPLEGSSRFTKSRRKISFSTKLNHLTSKSYQLRSKVAGRHKVLININGPAKSAGPAVVVSVYTATGSIVRKVVKLNGQGDGHVRVALNKPGTKRVVITLANASARYQCWQRAAFSCQGKPRDNGSVFSVTAQLK